MNKRTLIFTLVFVCSLVYFFSVKSVFAAPVCTGSSMPYSESFFNAEAGCLMSEIDSDANWYGDAVVKEDDYCYNEKCAYIRSTETAGFGYASQYPSTLYGDEFNFYFSLTPDNYDPDYSSIDIYIKDDNSQQLVHMYGKPDSQDGIDDLPFYVNGLFYGNIKNPRATDNIVQNNVHILFDYRDKRMSVTVNGVSNDFVVSNTRGVTPFYIFEFKTGDYTTVYLDDITLVQSDNWLSSEHEDFQVKYFLLLGGSIFMVLLFGLVIKLFI